MIDYTDRMNRIEAAQTAVDNERLGLISDVLIHNLGHRAPTGIHRMQGRKPRVLTLGGMPALPKHL